MKILIIDDERSIRYSLRMQLSRLDGVEVIAVESGEEGWELLARGDIALAVVDIKLPGIDGIEVLRRVMEKKLDTVVIMITYMSEARLAVKAMKMGAYDYFTKPFSLGELSASVKSVLGYIEKRAELSGADGGGDLLVGYSAAIRLAKELSEKVARAGLNTHILIEGETGTGKEVVARYIHRLFGPDKPFVALNCAAIPQPLQESELFGHEKGAFTDAGARRAGLLERANGGVLFLDEIGDMDIGLQAKLLRVLENKTFRRLGGADEIGIDALVIAATNKDLRKEAERGTFRRDLYYRVGVVPIHLEPLRSHPEDIPVLVEHFIATYRRRMDSAVTGVSEGALDILKAYEWSGNVRELKNTIERLMILSDKAIIDANDLPLEVFEYREEAPPTYQLDAMERNVISNCLKKHSYNITKTAEELGITRTTLRKKMSEYQLRTDAIDR